MRISVEEKIVKQKNLHPNIMIFCQRIFNNYLCRNIIAKFSEVQLSSKRRIYKEEKNPEKKIGCLSNLHCKVTWFIL